MYKLNSQDNQRYQVFLKISPEELENEAALLRTLIEKCASDGRTPLVNALIATLSKIAVSHQTTKVKAGQLLEKALFDRLALALVNLLADTLRDRNIPQWEDIISAVAGALPKTIEVIANEDTATPKD